MKILFVSTSIPPATDMQTTRNMYLIQALQKENNDVDILTCGSVDEENISPEFKSVLSKSKVFRTDYPHFYKHHIEVNECSRNAFTKKMHNVFINYLAIPDLYRGWEKKGLKLIEKNNLFDYDILITASGSYTAHIIGNEWCDRTKKKWIAEY